MAGDCAYAAGAIRLAELWVVESMAIYYFIAPRRKGEIWVRVHGREVLERFTTESTEKGWRARRVWELCLKGLGGGPVIRGSGGHNIEAGEGRSVEVGIESERAVTVAEGVSADEQAIGGANSAHRKDLFFGLRFYMAAMVERWRTIHSATRRLGTQHIQDTKM